MTKEKALEFKKACDEGKTIFAWYEDDMEPPFWCYVYEIVIDLDDEIVAFTSHNEGSIRMYHPDWSEEETNEYCSPEIFMIVSLLNDLNGETEDSFIMRAQSHVH